MERIDELIIRDKFTNIEQVSEILKEEITMEIIGTKINVTITHTALESLSRITYYGLQMICGNMEKIRYIGGSNRNEYNPQGASNSGNRNCRNIAY